MPDFIEGERYLMLFEHRFSYPFRLLKYPILYSFVINNNGIVLNLTLL